jgi:hypothetical protein
MLVETIFALLTTVCHGTKVRQRVWGYFRARVAWTMAAFNLLAQWGLEVDDNHSIHLSIAEFSLWHHWLQGNRRRNKAELSTSGLCESANR